MIFTSGSMNTWVEKNTREVIQTCSHCRNTVPHYVGGQLVGPALGFVFIPAKYNLGYKKYFLICSTCNFVYKKLTKAEVNNLKL